MIDAKGPELITWITAAGVASICAPRGSATVAGRMQHAGGGDGALMVRYLGKAPEFARYHPQRGQGTHMAMRAIFLCCNESSLDCGACRPGSVLVASLPDTQHRAARPWRCVAPDAPPGRIQVHLPSPMQLGVVISRDGRPLADLPAGAKIGTSAVRRHAQLGLYRPDLIIERVRGSVNRRINKLDDGEYDAILLARAGLERVGLDHRITEVLPTTWADGETPAMVPAVGAAVIGVQARTADELVMRLLDELNDPGTARHITAERTMLHMLRGHCNSPIAGHAHTTADGQLSLFGMVFNRDGSRWVRSHGWGPTDDPASLGAWVAGDLLRQGARRLITATRK
ncbi:hypothetical protein GCM10011581_10860 [Saccharopolyspora subtropica]|uniref:Hydroxymethylbilane synthase n=1 Tax=Saccharopolyspora thermophila TaxID=89367 RepID=A0A917JLL9_9PSEU|nr:hydroxymethylbilane synthase [Saccharopolyspora subtropica]GGI75609.1 hypothetical protein GCM10011581_10860 [Saccharopolyspora subtropica]